MQKAYAITAPAYKSDFSPRLHICDQETGTSRGTSKLELSTDPNY
ncbi:Uncharacterised protein [Legionella moravica]|uniref:Uncharacterized protein n=1 Tax=Legionella moravica TaxID=39962 RepID=A0A378JZQ1_9GAMM|nr:Uncharacterised protein [Legionella moravica]